MLKVIAIFFALLAVAKGQAGSFGLSANASSLCATNCDWSTVEVWENGRIPGPNDYVTLQSTSAITMTISSNYSIAGLLISDANKKSQVVIMVSGANLTISGTSTLGVSSTFTIHAGAYFYVGGQIENQGLLNVAGNMTCQGTSPSLQLSFGTPITAGLPVYATLTLQGGTIIAPFVVVSSTSNLYGSGYIYGQVSTTGTIKIGTPDAVGTLYISGQLDTTSSPTQQNSEIYVKVASPTSFDHLILGNTFIQAGDLYVETINGYTPLSHQQFIFANHTAQRNGFSDIRGHGLSGILNNKWTVGVDQQYTFLIYGSASTVAASFFVVVLCALLTTL